MSSINSSTGAKHLSGSLWPYDSKIKKPQILLTRVQYGGSGHGVSLLPVSAQSLYSVPRYKSYDELLGVIPEDNAVLLLITKPSTVEIGAIKGSERLGFNSGDRYQVRQ